MQTVMMRFMLTAFLFLVIGIHADVLQKLKKQNVTVGAGGKKKTSVSKKTIFQSWIEVQTPGKKMPIFKEGDYIRQSVILLNSDYRVKLPKLHFSLRDPDTGAIVKWSQIQVDGILDRDKIIYPLKLYARTKGAFIANYSIASKQVKPYSAEMVVIGRIQQKRVDAKRIFSSLSIKLVDEIDCSNVNDSHGFSDGGKRDSRIIAEDMLNDEGNALRVAYRETGDVYNYHQKDGSFMEWKLKLKAINKLYMVEYDYPDNRTRNFSVAIVQDYPDKHWTEVANLTGGEFALSNQVKTGQMLFFARTPDVSIIVANKEAGQRGAIVRFRIYEILDEKLPMADIELPEPKLFGEINLKSLRSLLVSTYTGKDFFKLWLDRHSPAGFKSLKYPFMAIENLICYIRFCGQNSLVIPVRVDDPQKRIDEIALLAAMFAENDLKLILMPEFTVAEKRSLLVDINGQVAGVPDPSDFRVRRYYLESLKKLVSRYGNSSAFKGVFIALNKPGMGIGFLDLEYGYGDDTIRRFKAKSGIKMPVMVGDDRFFKRFEWIRQNAAAQWREFKCNTLAAFIKECAELLANSKARLFLMPVNNRNFIFDTDNRKQWIAELKTSYDDMGCELEALKKIQNSVIVSQLPVGASRKPSMKNNYLVHNWRCYSDDALKLFDDAGCAGVVLDGGLYQNRISRINYPYNKNDEIILTEKSAGAGNHFMHQLNLALAGVGSSFIFVSSSANVYQNGHEVAKAAFAEVFEKIPFGTYRKVDGSNSKVVARYQVKPDDGILYISNLQGINAEVIISCKEESAIVPWSLLTGVADVLAGNKVKLNNEVIRLKLNAYETKVLRCRNLYPVEIVNVIWDAEQLQRSQKNKLASEHKVRINARIGDYGRIHLKLTNNGDSIPKSSIKILRHDDDSSMEETVWEIEPLKAGGQLVVSLPGELAGNKRVVEGVYVGNGELVPFAFEQQLPAIKAEYLSNAITIDGAFDDWQDYYKEILLMQLQRISGEYVKNEKVRRQNPDIMIKTAFVWNEDALYMYFDITDRELVRNKEHNPLRSGDCLKVYFDSDPLGDNGQTAFSDDDVELVFAPGNQNDRKNDFATSSYVLAETLKKKPELLKWQSALTENGYRIEARLAKELFPHFKLYDGKAMGLDIIFNDLDSVDRANGHVRYECNREYIWHNASSEIENRCNTSQYGALLLTGITEEAAVKAPLELDEPIILEPFDFKQFFCDFEKDTGIMFLASGNLVLERVSRSDFFHGQYSLKLDGRLGRDGKLPFVLLNKKFMVPVNNQYEVSFWAYAEHSLPVMIEIDSVDGEGKSLKTLQKEPVYLKKGWFRYRVGQAHNVRLYEEKTVKVCLKLLQSGIVVIDNLVVSVKEKKP